MPIAIGPRAIVEQFDDAPKSASGLALPDEAKDGFKVAKGRVLSVGATFPRAPEGGCLVSEGDAVYFNKFAGERIRDPGGRELLVLKDTEILAKD